MAGHRKNAREGDAQERGYPLDAAEADRARRAKLRERNRAANRRYRARHRAELLERKRRRYAEDPEYKGRLALNRKAYWVRRKAERSAHLRHRYLTDPEYRERRIAVERRSLLKKYGMTPEDYDAMLARQNGACAICATTAQPRLAVDHDHDTKMVRMLLCNACNKGLGNFKDQPRWLRKAADLVEEARARHLGLADAAVGGAQRPPVISLRLLRAVCGGSDGATGEEGG